MNIWPSAKDRTRQRIVGAGFPNRGLGQVKTRLVGSFGQFVTAARVDVEVDALEGAEVEGGVSEVLAAASEEAVVKGE